MGIPFLIALRGSEEPELIGKCVFSLKMTQKGRNQFTSLKTLILEGKK